jgi:hypothetical protein
MSTDLSELRAAEAAAARQVTDALGAEVATALAADLADRGVMGVTAVEFYLPRGSDPSPTRLEIGEVLLDVTKDRGVAHVLFEAYNDYVAAGDSTLAEWVDRQRTLHNAENTTVVAVRPVRSDSDEYHDRALAAAVADRLGRVLPSEFRVGRTRVDGGMRVVVSHGQRSLTAEPGEWDVAFVTARPGDGASTTSTRLEADETDVDVIADRLARVAADVLPPKAVWADHDGTFVLSDGSVGNPGCDECGQHDAVVRVDGTYLCDTAAAEAGVTRSGLDEQRRPLAIKAVRVALDVSAAKAANLVDRTERPHPDQEVALGVLLADYRSDQPADAVAVTVLLRALLPDAHVTVEAGSTTGVRIVAGDVTFTALEGGWDVLHRHAGGATAPLNTGARPDHRDPLSVARKIAKTITG